MCCACAACGFVLACGYSTIAWAGGGACSKADCLSVRQPAQHLVQQSMAVACLNLSNTPSTGLKARALWAESLCRSINTLETKVLWKHHSQPWFVAWTSNWFTTLLHSFASHCVESGCDCWWQWYTELGPQTASSPSIEYDPLVLR